MRSVLRKWRSPEKTTKANPERHLLAANRNIRELIEDTNIPSSVRAELSSEFDEIESISSKLRNGEVHIAAFGRVGVGKSSLLNALLQRKTFSTSPLHGETKKEFRADWRTLREGQVVLIDTPGIRELGLWELDAADLRFFFPDLCDLAPGCRFSDCSHLHEPDCAVRAAVADGSLDAARYATYQRIHADLRAERRF